MQLMVATYPETTEEELKSICQFRRSTILLYLQILDARNHWQTLVTYVPCICTSTLKICCLFGVHITLNITCKGAYYCYCYYYYFYYYYYKHHHHYYFHLLFNCPVLNWPFF